MGIVEMWNADLAAGHVVLVAVDKRPQRFRSAKKFRREDAVLQNRRVRPPIRTDPEVGELALAFRDTAQRLGVAGREPVPDAPDVFPTLKPNAVEERLLQNVGVIARPPPARLQQW